MVELTRQMRDDMKSAADQMDRLRRDNELLHARLSGFDDAMRLLDASTQCRGRGEEVDFASILRRHAIASDVPAGVNIGKLERQEPA